MNLYRCEQCGTTFEATRPKCDKCGIDPDDNPRFAAVFSQLVTIHYDPPTIVPGIGTNKIACTGQPVGPHRATGDPAVVNCQTCRASDAWKANYKGESKVRQEHDDVAADVLPTLDSPEGADVLPLPGMSAGSGGGIAIAKPG